MKTGLLALVGCLGMMWGVAFGYGSYKGEYYPTPVYQKVACASPSGCAPTCTTMNDGCNSCSSMFTAPCYSCSCTDPNCASNPCMSSCRYCSDFGNVGGFDFVEQL